MMVATEAVEWPYLEMLVLHINEKAAVSITHTHPCIWLGTSSAA